MQEDIVDDITLYWLTNTAILSARLYWESKLGGHLAALEQPQILVSQLRVAFNPLP